jgi:hypothetical protein
VVCHRGEHKLRILENKMLRRIFVTKREEMIEGYRIVFNL